MIDMKNIQKKFRRKDVQAFILFCLLGIFWISLLFLLFFQLAHTKVYKLLFLFPMQLSLTMLYTDYKVASINKELSSRNGKESSLSNSSEQKTVIKNTKLLYIIVLGIIVLGFSWYLMHKYIMTIE